MFLLYCFWSGLGFGITMIYLKTMQNEILSLFSAVGDRQEARAVVVNRWATARKSGGPRTSVLFENGSHA